MRVSTQPNYNPKLYHLAKLINWLSIPIARISMDLC